MLLHIVPNQRIVSWGLLALLLAVMVSLTPQKLSAAPPSVTFVGADTTTNDAWRTTSVAKPLDIDGDNIYGSDGFYLYSGGTHTLTAPPPYATVSPRPGMTVYSGNASYIFYDNPDLTGAGPIPNVLTGVIYNTNNPTEWVDITFTQPGLFRVGIITDNADFIPISPLNFRFQQITGGTVDTGYVAASGDRDRDIDYYLFDVEANAGDVYRLSGQNDPGHTSNGIAAIFFDGIPTLTITDTTAGTATNDGTVNVSEYVGFTTGINNGFGNVIGSASQLHIDSDGSGNLNLGLEAGAAVVLPNAMVIYLDTDNGATGFTTTSGFTDAGDGCRRAISGYDGGNRSTLNFAPGFAANYAICLDSSFAGLWELTNSGSHPFVTSLNRSNSGTEYEMNFTLANLGLNAGDSFRYVATYLNHDNAFRSNEFHGVAIFAGGNPGYATVNLTANSFIVFEAVDTTLVVDRADDTNAAAAQVCDDALPNDCSLRGAISKANADTTGAYTITFDPSLNGTPLTLTVAGTGEDANATGDLDITDDLTITGNGATSTIIQAGTNSTNGLDRVFHIGSGSNVTFNDVTIRFGNISAAGGGIYNFAGTVTVNQSTISSNTANFGGGMMNEQGIATLNQSTVAGNVATGNGGGIDSDAFGLSATLNIYNSTISSNSAGYAGGGILAYTGGAGNTTVNLSNATVHNNSGSVGGLTGWDNGGGVVTFNLQNSVIADQAGALTDCAIINGGSFVSNNYNLDSDGTCNLIQPNDIPAGTANLGPLQDNGGPTFTHALLGGSQAIDAGSNGVCAAAPINNVDQRGVSRPQNLTCDIGAYELVTAVTPSINGGLGPGGVGHTDGSTPLELWLDGDEGVFTNTGCTTVAANGNLVGCWADQSGNNNHATQGTGGTQPIYVTNALNGQPILQFDGGDDVLNMPDATVPVGNTPYTVFALVNADVLGARGFLGSGNFGVGNEANAFRFNGGGEVINYWWGNDLISPGGSVATGVNYVLSFSYNTSSGRSLRINGNLSTTNGSTARNGGAPNNTIGKTVGGEFWDGNIIEMILFSNPLNITEQILVENYLSAKYNRSVTNDVYDGDTPGNGEFDLDVAGIGQLGGNQHTQAHSAGMIVVNSTFLNENGDWLLFGHNTPTNNNTIIDVPISGDWDGVNDVRWARHWTVDVTDPSVNDGTVDIIFDFSEADMNGGLPPSTPASHYRLLKRTGTTGLFSDITVASGALVVVAGDQVQFLGVDVAQLGSNFTLGSIDGAAAPTAITTQNIASQTGQPTYLTLLVLLLLLLAGTIAVVWRRIV
jgi:hypothetical protein